MLVTGAPAASGTSPARLRAPRAPAWSAPSAAPTAPRWSRPAGAHQVIVGDLEAARPHGPFHLVLDSVGGDTFPQALGLLGPGGTRVIFGSSAGPESTVNWNRFYLMGGANLYGFYLFEEVKRHPTRVSLARLVALVADGRLRPHIAVEAPWTEIATRAQQLLDRDVPGRSPHTSPPAAQAERLYDVGCLTAPASTAGVYWP